MDVRSAEKEVKITKIIGCTVFFPQFDIVHFVVLVMRSHLVYYNLCFREKIYFRCISVRQSVPLLFALSIEWQAIKKY